MKWKTIPLFISSTFQDMHAERDYLKENVFPIIEERLLKRNCQLEIIDLRWGVFTKNNKQAIEKELYVLSVCMNELEKSRPYFLGILGNRYGWVPPEAISKEIMHEFGIKINPKDRSITEMEILSGSLEAPVSMKPLFFFRDGSVVEQIPDDEKINYCDNSAGFSKDYLKLTALKEKLHYTYPNQVFEYAAIWDDKKKQISGLEEFGNLVLKNLWQQFDIDTVDHNNETESWVEEDNMLVHSNIVKNVQNSILRENLEDEFYDELIEKSPSFTLISGSIGSGKSTFIAQLLFGIIKRNDFLPLIHVGGFNSRGQNLDHMIIRFIEILKKEIETDLPFAEDIPKHELDEVFNELLTKVCEKKGVIIVIDEIHLMEKSERSRYLTWINRELPLGCFFFMSGSACDQIETLKSSTDYMEFEIPDITETEARLIILNICKKYHRDLSTELLDAIIARTDQEGLRLYSNPLWLTLATEQINLVRYEDFLNSRKSNASNPEEALVIMLKNVIDHFPNGHKSMYNYILNHFEKVFGKTIIKMFSAILALAREGWRFSDLKAILFEGGLTLTDLDVSRVILAYRGHVNSISDDGRIFFMSQEFRNAIEERYFHTRADKEKIHQQIARYLEKLPDNEPVKSSELMYHYIKGDQYAKAMHYFYPTLPVEEYKGAVEAVADQIIYYGSGKAQDELGLGKLFTNFLSAKPIEQWDSYQLLLEVITSVYENLMNRIPLDAKKYILENSLSILNDLVQSGFKEEYVINRILIGKRRLAELKTALGDAGSEMMYYLENIDKFKIEYEQRPDNIYTMQNYSIALFNKSSQVINEGLADEAEDDLLKAYELTKKSSELESDNPIHLIGIIEILQLLSQVYKAESDKSKVQKTLQEAFAFANKAISLDSSKVECHQSMATVYMLIGNYEEWVLSYERALENYKKSLEIRTESLRRHPDNISYLYDLAIIQYKMGHILKKLNQSENAIAYAKEARGLFEIVCQSDPNNSIWYQAKTRAEAFYKNIYQELIDNHEEPMSDQLFSELLVSFKDHFTIGAKYVQGHDYKNGSEKLQLALNDIERCSSKEKSNLDLRSDHALTLTKLAEAYEFMGLLDEAMGLITKAVDLQSLVCETDSENLNYLKTYAEVNFRMGWIFYRLEQREEAAKYAKIALDLYTKLYETDEDNIDYEYALEDAEDLWDIFDK